MLITSLTVAGIHLSARAPEHGNCPGVATQITQAGFLYKNWRKTRHEQHISLRQRLECDSRFIASSQMFRFWCSAPASRELSRVSEVAIQSDVHGVP